ncbi:hypothetical protein BKD09_05170 [Bradyrhizobium japonicum]|uniref:Uncharacterized protein n=1 Tax=Bradyrhizobium japonicum TaxID=375 RepID=A0A1L3F357_BRAJP|nr:hypothetical protein BKD09_05170 [Bradyrhizobium japonicum]
MAARVVTWRHTFVRGRLLSVGRTGRHCEAVLPAEATVRSLPPCGGGRGRGVAPEKVYPSAIVPRTTNRGSPRAVPLSLSLPRKGGGNDGAMPASLGWREWASATPKHKTTRRGASRPGRWKSWEV